MKKYELELPQNYVEAKTVDAKSDKKVMTIFTIVSLFVNILAVVIAVFCLNATQPDWVDQVIQDETTVTHSLLYIVAMLAYVVLHELTHGIVYKIETKQKLTFGLTLTVAYCGVPNIYVYRKTALKALLAPFVVFLPILIVVLCLVTNPIDVVWSAFLLGMHVGGCVGDLYCTYLYLFKFRDNSTLMRDTGPVQTYYVPAE